MTGLGEGDGAPHPRGRRQTLARLVAERRMVPGKLDVLAQQAGGENAVKGAAMRRGGFEKVDDVLGPSRHQRRSRAPEAARRDVPRRGGFRCRQRREMDERALEPAASPRRQSGDPIGDRRVGARALGAGGGEFERFGIVAGEEVRLGHALARAVELDLVEQRGEPTREVPLRALGVVRPEVRVDAAPFFAHGAPDGGAALARRAIRLGRDRRNGGRAAAVETGLDRRFVTPGLAPQRQAVDALGAGMIVVGLHPLVELEVLGAILGGVHVALEQDVTHKDIVLEGRDLAVRLGPRAVLLKREDPAVGSGVRGRQRRRQRQLAVLVRWGGPGRQALERGHPQGHGARRGRIAIVSRGRQHERQRDRQRDRQCWRGEPPGDGRHPAHA